MLQAGRLPTHGTSNMEECHGALDGPVQLSSGPKLQNPTSTRQVRGLKYPNPKPPNSCSGPSQWLHLGLGGSAWGSSYQRILQALIPYPFPFGCPSCASGFYTHELAQTSKRQDYGIQASNRRVKLLKL